VFTTSWQVADMRDPETTVETIQTVTMQAGAPGNLV
jgi:hypothetical protein